jgi:hypothetical protein
MSVLKLRSFAVGLMLMLGLISVPANAGWQGELFELIIKGFAKEEKLLVKEETKIVSASSGWMDDFVNWVKRTLGFPAESKIERELAKKFGQQVKEKVIQETKVCVREVVKRSSVLAVQNPKTYHAKKQNEAQDDCAQGVMNCLNVNYKSIKNPTPQMLNNCIVQINKNIYKYIK